MGQMLDDAAPLPLDDQQRANHVSNEGGVMALTLAQIVATARSEAREISPAQAAQADNQAELNMIVDVREPAEYRDSHLPRAVNIPRGLLELRADPASPAADATLSANRAARILVYCTKGPGARSLLAAQTLRSMGYERVEVLGGGLMAWAEAGLPVESESQQVTA
jgi:rhodanese-related sulfurtransferase